MVRDFFKKLLLGTLFIGFIFFAMILVIFAIESWAIDLSIQTPTIAALAIVARIFGPILFLYALGHSILKIIR